VTAVWKLKRGPVQSAGDMLRKDGYPTGRKKGRKIGRIKKREEGGKVGKTSASKGRRRKRMNTPAGTYR